MSEYGIRSGTVPEDVEATANAKTVSVTDADMLTYILFD